MHQITYKILKIYKYCKYAVVSAILNDLSLESGADTGGGTFAPPPDRFRFSPPLNLEFVVPIFRIASQ